MRCVGGASRASVLSIRNGESCVNGLLNIHARNCRGTHATTQGPITHLSFFIVAATSQPTCTTFSLGISACCKSPSPPGRIDGGEARAEGAAQL